MNADSSEVLERVDGGGAAAAVDPRVERSRQTVIAATVELLGELGYGALSVEAVAARSGVAKSTIYRHWPNKDALAARAFAHIRVEASTAPPPGPVRERAAVILRALALKTRAPDFDPVACLPALVEGAAQCSEMAQEAARLAEERARPLVEVLQDGIAGGEIPAGDPAVLADALAGPIILRKLFHQELFDPDDVPALVDRILSG